MDLINIFLLTIDTNQSKMSTCFICLKVVKKVRVDYICRKCRQPPDVNLGILPDDILKIIRSFVGNFTLRPHYEKMVAIYIQADKTKFDKTLYGNENYFKTFKETPKCFKVSNYQTYTPVYEKNGRRCFIVTQYGSNSKHTLIKKTDLEKIKGIQTWIWHHKYSDLKYYIIGLLKKLRKLEI